MKNINIYNDSINNEKLIQIIEEEIESLNINSDIKFELQVNKNKRGLDVTVLVALITAFAATFGILIESLIRAYLKRKDGENAIISIKGKNGREIKFPVKSTEEDIKKYIDLAKELEVECIIILEDV